MIVSFLEKQVYMYVFLNKRVKMFFKPENYCQKKYEKVSWVGKCLSRSRLGHKNIYCLFLKSIFKISFTRLYIFTP